MIEADDKVFLVTPRRACRVVVGEQRKARAQDHARGRRVAATLERQVYAKLIKYSPEEVERPPEILGATDDPRTTRLEGEAGYLGKCPSNDSNSR